MIEDSKAKLRLIIVGSESKDEVIQIVEKIAPRNGSFKVKLIDRCACKNYQLIDDNEVWIATQQKTQTGYPSILWTTDSNIVEAYLENFNETWNNPKATVVYRTPSVKGTEKPVIVEDSNGYSNCHLWLGFSYFGFMDSPKHKKRQRQHSCRQQQKRQLRRNIHID